MSMQRIEITPDFVAALQLAVETRRGAMLRCAPLPEPEQTDMLAIRDVLAGLIDAIGDREQMIATLRLNLDDALRALRVVASTVAEIDLGDPDSDDSDD
jgi:hypothetical protein